MAAAESAEAKKKLADKEAAAKKLLEEAAAKELVEEAKRMAEVYFFGFFFVPTSPYSYILRCHPHHTPLVAEALAAAKRVAGESAEAKKKLAEKEAAAKKLLEEAAAKELVEKANRMAEVFFFFVPTSPYSYILRCCHPHHTPLVEEALAAVAEDAKAAEEHQGAPAETNISTGIQRTSIIPSLQQH